MKKLSIIVVCLLLLCVVGFFALEMFLGHAVTAGVNRVAPGITQTRVTLGGATISPLSGSGTLTDLVVGNPKGWSENNICSLGKIHVDLEPFSVLGDRIIVNKIEIDAPEFNYETKLISSNVKDLLKNIEAAVGGGKSSSGTDAKPAGESKPIKIEVKDFELKNAKVRLGVGDKGLTLPMPDLKLTDIGTKEGGVTPDQLALAVMKEVTGNIISATAKAAGDISKTSGASAAEGVKKVGEAVKNLFGGDKKK